MTPSTPQSSPSGPPSRSQGWDLCRFLKTLAYFGVVPVLSGFGWFQQLFDSTPDPQVNQGAIAYGQPSSSSVSSGSAAVSPNIMIFDFRHPRASLTDVWGSVDDVVMGGVSSSRMVQTDDGALFTGDVSTENSGGFASVRTRNFDPALDLSAFDGIALRLRGDGKRYKLILRDESRWDGVGYSASFNTVDGEWMTVQIPFSDLIPVFRARSLSDGQHIDPSQIRAVQVMFSKFEYDGALNPTFEPGAFQLLIESIQGFSEER